MRSMYIVMRGSRMMKRKLIWKLAVGAAVLSLSACGGQSTEAPVSEKSAAMESSLETTAESSVEESSTETITESSEEQSAVSEEEELPTNAEQKELDVDGDGENETIYFAVNPTSAEYVLSVKKSNGETIFFDDNEQEFVLEDVCLDFIESEPGKGIFYIMSSLGSDWGDYCIYGYDKGEIKTFGVISAYVYDLECDGEQLTTLTSSYTIHSDKVKNHYEMDWEKGSLKLIPEERELLVQHWDDDAFVIDCVKELTLHTEADENAGIIMLKPQKIKFTKINADETWIYVLGEDGTGGWLEKGDDWSRWREYFENLTYFG